jgi:RNA polymerase sigma-70 factor (TIGR02957 family)
VTEAALLEEVRPAAFAVAYRMLGSVVEAEDVVQEALLRLHQELERGEEIASPRAFVATVVTRLSIDQLRSARVRREQYVGEWMPEPLVTDLREDPAARAETADSLSFAFLVLLEKLTPEQRAAFLLHDVFDYPYSAVAEIVGTSEDNARQLASRGRNHMREGRPRFEASSEQREQLAASFFAAAERGDLEGLETILARDVEVHGDGGGKAPAIARVLRGRTRVVRTLGAWWKVTDRLGVSLERTEVNGQPGALFRDPSGKLIGVLVLDIAGGEIVAVRSVVNPDKLGHLGPVGDARALLMKGRSAGAKALRGDAEE